MRAGAYDSCQSASPRLRSSAARLRSRTAVHSVHFELHDRSRVQPGGSPPPSKCYHAGIAAATGGQEQAIKHFARCGTQPPRTKPVAAVPRLVAEADLGRLWGSPRSATATMAQRAAQAAAPIAPGRRNGTVRHSRRRRPRLRVAECGRRPADTGHLPPVRVTAAHRPVSARCPTILRHAHGGCRGQRSLFRE